MKFRRNEMKVREKLFIGFLAFVILSTFSVNVKAAENMVPDYEVKLLLDSNQVLNEEKQLKKEYRELWNMEDTYETTGVLYVDTPDLTFNGQGWINRVRVKESSKKFELTYKKRYKISNENIDGALTMANHEGFDIKDTNYEAQIDWGYQNMTLSLSRKKDYSNSGYEKLQLPEKKDAIKMLKSEMPGKEQDWLYKDWGKNTIGSGEVYGPIYYSKYTGKYQGIDFDLEIWPIYSKKNNSTEYVTEISFKEDTYEAAAAKRQKLMKALDDDGILMHEDSLKTQKILQAYQ